MVNDMLRIRSGRGKMGSEIGEPPSMNPQQAKKLGRHLRKTREALGLSAREVARRTGLGDSTIVRIEQGAFPTPNPETLGRIASVLGVNLADVYVMADYPVPNELPTLRPYLRARYGRLPASAADEIEAYAQRLAQKHGVDLAGPAPGEDEAAGPRATPRQRTTKKGGTR
jgi:transcriptional regulator with XRE-family HTH domain